MSAGLIAILEDDVDRERVMRDVLSTTLPDLKPVVFANAHEMLEWLPQHLHEIVLISLDHDLPVMRDADGRTVDFGDGKLVAEVLATYTATAPVIVHTSNLSAGLSMSRVLRDAGWHVRRVLPHDDLLWISGEWQKAIESLRADAWFDHVSA